MSELTVDQALQQAIENHKAGKLEDAERLYRAILQIRPRHPDVNHNLGVLAVSVDKPDAALPFLKTAVEANPNQEQYWVSYVDALIKANQLKNAQSVLFKGRQIGLQGDAVDQLEERLHRVALVSKTEVAPKNNEASSSGSQKPSAKKSKKKVIRASQHLIRTSPTQAEISALVNAFNKGHYPEAEQRALAMTQAFSNDPFGWKVLGAALKQTGGVEKALVPMQRSVELSPLDAEAHSNLGNALKDLGRPSEAEASYRQAIALKPGFAEAHYNLGNTLKDLGRLSEAEASYRQAIALKHDFAEAHYNLGNTLKDLGRLSEAEASYRQGIALTPGFAEAHYNLGNTLKGLGRLWEAEASYRQAIALKPGYAEPHSNLGNTLKDLGRLSEAEASYRQAIALKHDLAEAHSNLGNTLKDLGRLSEAEASYRQAIALKHDFAEAHYNLGNTLKDLGRLSEAAASYRQAIALKSDFAEAHSNLLFSMNYVEKLCVTASLEEALRYGANVSRRATNKYTSWRCSRSPERLRIGFVSGDLRNHPVGYFLEGLLSNIDQSKYELVAYSTVLREDELTKRIKPYFKLWQPLFGKSDDVSAQMIHDDGVHILIDLAGHTAHNRLPVFVFKPAPVQVTWLGYCGTTGVQEIDYLLGDAYATPADEEEQFVESIWRLPESYICLTPPGQEVQIDVLPARRNGYVTFGSFNNLSKITGTVVSLWAQILTSVEQSRLFLKTKQFKDERTVQDTIERFRKFGIHADRLIIEGKTPSHVAHLEAYNRVDIALDTYPYNGVTTSAEALWMGVPVITKKGDRFIAHNGETIANNAGQSGWIARDEKAYVLKAKDFAADLDALAKIRSGLRAQVLASPLFDSKRFTRHFEEAMTGMWEKFRETSHVVLSSLQESQSKCTQKATLKFADDISVVVPDSLNLITTYVLREQGDWFEDEIKFVRLLLKPNQKAIDIGANYGLFTLSMAKIVGPGGSIWAFEPTSSTAAFLSDSLSINGFNHVVLDRRALSERAGTAQLSLNDNSELNELVRDGASAGASETVNLISLDDAMHEHGWSDIEFVKIDAEGEEGAIIRGGNKFFQTQSPLVQYEVKAGQSIHLELVQAFADIGYTSYRLVPGLGALVPFDPREEVDTYLLNLYCCKPDRAEKTAVGGRLVLTEDIQADEHTQRVHNLLQGPGVGSAYGWQNSLAQLPYGKTLAERWRQTISQGKSGEVEKALALHAIAHDNKLPITARFLALRASLEILRAACSKQPEFLRLASLARVAREFGARAVAVTALNDLVQLVMKYQQVNPSEPFLASNARFDNVDPKEAIGNWVLGSTLEELERNQLFSSFYTGQAAKQRLEVIRNLGFGSPEMARRLALIEHRFPNKIS